MTLKTFLDYLKYSGVWVTFAVNPYHWKISYHNEDYGKNLLHCVTFGPITIRGILDNGQW